jgi:triosephosphate isomerase
MKKKKIVIGNWKMNPDTLKEAKALNDSIKRKLMSVKKTVAVVCPPSIYFSELKGKGLSKKLSYGIQNIGKERSGACTGDISAYMIKSMGASYGLVGHSERRAAGETNEDVAKKVRLLLTEKIIPVVCVGETAIDDHAGHLAFVKTQIVKALEGVSPTEISNIIIAYEPVFAIGAKTPITSYEIHQRNIFIKKVLTDLYGKNKAFDVPILYGGSVNADNALELVKGGEVDGLLVGRDSLKAENFIKILKELDTLA